MWHGLQRRRCGGMFGKPIKQDAAFCDRRCSIFPLQQRDLADVDLHRSEPCTSGSGTPHAKATVTLLATNTRQAVFETSCAQKPVVLL
jgi:hypothetical protein